MKFEDHVKITEMVMGEGYPEVHEWIDACFPDYLHDGKHSNYGTVNYHWIERHHTEALAVKYEVNSPEYLAGCLHIICDWISHWGRAYLPTNKNAVLTLLNKTYE